MALHWREASLLPLSSRGSGGTCQLPLPTPSRLPREKQAHTLALAVSGEVAQHSSLPRAHAVLRWLWFT